MQKPTSGNGWQPWCSSGDIPCESSWGVWSQATLHAVAAGFTNRSRWEALPISRYVDALAPSRAPAHHLIHCMPHCTRGSTLYRNLEGGLTNPPPHSVICKTGLLGTRGLSNRSQYAFDGRPSYNSSFMHPCVASFSLEGSSICCMPAIQYLHGIGLSMDSNAHNLATARSAQFLEIKCNPIAISAFTCKSPCCGTLQRVYEAITSRRMPSSLAPSTEEGLLALGENISNKVAPNPIGLRQTEGCHLHAYERVKKLSRSITESSHAPRHLACGIASSRATATLPGPEGAPRGTVLTLTCVEG